MFALNVLQGRISWKDTKNPFMLQDPFRVTNASKRSTERTLT